VQADTEINIGLSKDSKELAAASKRDSSAMKIIAFLTTLFLPGTFVAVSLARKTNNVVSDSFADYLLTVILRDAAVRLAGPFY
jgi:hypothetical protein